MCNIEIKKQNTFKYNFIRKDKMGEYDEFAAKDFEFNEEEENKKARAKAEKEAKAKKQKASDDAYIEQELFNFKVERIVGIEKEKLEFDTKYKEKLVDYINKNSFKDKRNTGTLLGKSPILCLRSFLEFR